MVKQGTVFGGFCNGSIGKSRLWSALGPAIFFAEPEKKTLLIDLDIGGPSQEIYNKGIIENKGYYLHEFLSCEKNIEDIITKTKYPHYDIILSDVYHKPIIDKDSSCKLETAIKKLKKEYDHILLDIGSAFDYSSGNSTHNGDDLSKLIDLADRKFLLTVANDEGKTLNRGVKTVRDYAFYLIKKEIDDYLDKNKNDSDN